MNLRELYEELGGLLDSGTDPETIVRFAYDYGDHSHTTIAPEVDHVDIEMVKPNSYVDDMAICDDHEQDDADAQKAIVLGC